MDWTGLDDEELWQESGKRIYYGSAIFVMNGFQRNVCTKKVNEWLLHVEEKSGQEEDMSGVKWQCSEHVRGI